MKSSRLTPAPTYIRGGSRYRLRKKRQHVGRDVSITDSSRVVLCIIVASPEPDEHAALLTAAHGDTSRGTPGRRDVRVRHRVEPPELRPTETQLYALGRGTPRCCRFDGRRRVDVPHQHERGGPRGR